MKRLLSASRIVFILIALTACYAFIKGILPVDQFMLLATGCFSFYFTKSVPESEIKTTIQ